MKGNILEYKGYHAKIDFSAEDGILFGKIEGIQDLVNFEAENTSEIVREFHRAVDDYLTYCDELGKTPEKEYNGVFNIRTSAEIHRNLAKEASLNGITLNRLITNIFETHFSLEKN